MFSIPEMHRGSLEPLPHNLAVWLWRQWPVPSRRWGTDFPANRQREFSNQQRKHQGSAAGYRENRGTRYPYRKLTFGVRSPSLHRTHCRRECRTLAVPEEQVEGSAAWVRQTGIESTDGCLHDPSATVFLPRINTGIKHRQHSHLDRSTRAET